MKRVLRWMPKGLITNQGDNTTTHHPWIPHPFSSCCDSVVDEPQPSWCGVSPARVNQHPQQYLHLFERGLSS
jgi:hypothetical protein